MSVKRYAEIIASEQTPQSAPIPGREADMQRNAAGGFAFRIDPWALLDRWLILNSDKPTYYTSAKDLTKTNLDSLRAIIALDGERVVRRVVEISDAGRAPRNDAAILALALCAKTGDLPTRQAALAALPRVCRTGTHLFTFAQDLQLFGGWGRGTKRAMGRWYLDKSPKDLAYQLTKYAQREGWSHRDVLRLAHPKPDGAHQPFLQYAAKGTWEGGDGVGGVGADYMDALRAVQIMAGEDKQLLVGDLEWIARQIKAHRLPREVLPSALLTKPEVWEALLDDMPLTALIRNLATMTRVGLLAPLSDATRQVVTRLGQAEGLRRARVHPIQVLMALRTYSAGKGLRGQHTWTPVPQVVQALDEAFYLAYQSVEPAGGKMLLALDVSGSMAWGTVGGVDGLSPREASAAVALVIANTEPEHSIMAFAEQFVPLDLTKGMRLHDATKAVSGVPFGRTDVSIPLTWALENKVAVDTFVTITDNETYFGTVHPAQALQRYRQEMGIPAKMIVLAMTATESSVADPNDTDSLDIVGFDAAIPELINSFARGPM